MRQIQDLCIDAAQRYVERRCVHQVVPSPLPRTWKRYFLISSLFTSFFQAPSHKPTNFPSDTLPFLYLFFLKPPPTSLKDIHCIILPFVYLFCSSPSHEPEKFHHNILRFYIFFPRTWTISTLKYSPIFIVYPGPLPQTWTPFHINILPYCISFSKPPPTSLSTVSAHPLFLYFFLPPNPLPQT